MSRGEGADRLVAALARAVGAPHVLADPDVTAGYGTDWTRRFSGPVLAVVRPGSTPEVAAVVDACRAAGVPVVPQGGNTGLVGGGVPQPGRPAVVLSTRRLDTLGAVTGRQVTVGAGATVAAVQAHAAAHGLAYGVDLASRDSATVGGTLATNAGGLHVVRHGDTRRQVMGVEAVLADGSVISRLAGLAKDASGYDLAQLLVGSEGTLGVVTAVRLRLVAAAPLTTCVTLVGVPDVTTAQRLADQPGLRAAELVTEQALSLAESVLGLPHPVARRWPAYLLLETDAVPQLPGDVDAAVDPRMWEYRERLTEAVAGLGVVHKLDVGLPSSVLSEFLDRLDPLVAPARAYVFGHLAEANLHVNLASDEPLGDEVDERVLRVVASYGGTISSEHGVGAAKARWLPLTRSAAEIAAMRRLKAALDPTGLLNPGVLLPGA